MALEVTQTNPGTISSVGYAEPEGSRDGEVFWIGQDGNVWLRQTNGQTVNLGTPQEAKVWDLGLNGAMQIDDPVVASQDGSGDGGGGYTTPGKTLNTAQLTSLDSFINSLNPLRDQSIEKAKIARDTSITEKKEEREREKGKYQGSKLSTLQDFAGAKTDTDLNTRNTLENLISSLSTLGLGGSRALTRQILDAANMSNRKANATQATNNRDLDSSWNDYDSGYDNDIAKIQDQFGYDRGEALRKYYQDKQTAFYKKADVYGSAEDTANRDAMMSEGDSLNQFITDAAFMNPKYTGETRKMDTPELGDYTQNIAKYDTTNIGSTGDAMTPVMSDGMNSPGNLAVRAIAVNDKDLGIKKKSENDLGYGV